MSRVDEALGRAAALAGTQPGTPLIPGHDFTPASEADLWPAETIAPDEPGAEMTPAPLMQHLVPTDVASDAEEKLVSRLQQVH